MEAWPAGGVALCLVLLERFRGDVPFPFVFIPTLNHLQRSAHHQLLGEASRGPHVTLGASFRRVALELRVSLGNREYQDGLVQWDPRWEFELICEQSGLIAVYGQMKLSSMNVCRAKREIQD